MRTSQKAFSDVYKRQSKKVGAEASVTQFRFAERSHFFSTKERSVTRGMIPNKAVGEPATGEIYDRLITFSIICLMLKAK